MPPTRQSLVPQPMSSSGTGRCSTAPPKSHEVGGSGFGYAAHELANESRLYTVLSEHLYDYVYLQSRHFFCPTPAPLPTHHASRANLELSTKPSHYCNTVLTLTLTRTADADRRRPPARTDDTAASQSMRHALPTAAPSTRPSRPLRLDRYVSTRPSRPLLSSTCAPPHNRSRAVS